MTYAPQCLSRYRIVIIESELSLTKKELADITKVSAYTVFRDHEQWSEECSKRDITVSERHVRSDDEGFCTQVGLTDDQNAKNKRSGVYSFNAMFIHELNIGVIFHNRARFQPYEMLKLLHWAELTQSERNEIDRIRALKADQ